MLVELAGGARGRGRQIIRGQDGEAWMWAG